MDYKLFQEHRETKYGIHLVEETSLDTFVYSIVHLNDTGKVIVAIAMNPRGNKPISEEENRINNANSQNVTKLEPTRRTALYRFSDLFGYKSFKELIQVDIFSKRTIQSKQLDYEIRNAVDRTELDRLIGFNNYETIKAEVEKADYVLLDWEQVFHGKNLVTIEMSYINFLKITLKNVFGLEQHLLDPLNIQISMGKKDYKK